MFSSSSALRNNICGVTTLKNVKSKKLLTTTTRKSVTTSSFRLLSKCQRTNDPFIRIISDSLSFPNLFSATTVSSSLLFSRRTFSSSCSNGSSGAYHTTRPLLLREINKNTLKDTPTGYIDDPSVQPRFMREYPPLSPRSEMLLESIRQEKELKEREELAYKGYTTEAVREAKLKVLDLKLSKEELSEVVKVLYAEVDNLFALLGKEVKKEPSRNKILLLKWQQRQRRLQDRDGAFKVVENKRTTANQEGKDFAVVLNPDGSESIVRRRKPQEGEDGVTSAEEGKKQQSNTSDTTTNHNKEDHTLLLDDEDDPDHLWRSIETEVLPPELLETEMVEVTLEDMHHVRYLLGLALRRLERYSEAVEQNMIILREELTNVDAMESLLEMYCGADVEHNRDGSSFPRLKELFDFLDEEYRARVAEGRVVPPPVPSEYLVEEGTSTNTNTNANASNSEADKTNSAASTTSNSSTALTHDNNNNHNKDKTTPTTFLAPVEMAIHLLADMITEQAAMRCQVLGEGATAKFFLEALGPIAAAVGPHYTSLLLQALFKSVDTQLFVANFDRSNGGNITEGQQQLMFSFSIAFFKVLLARNMSELVVNPLNFEYFTLHKLYIALRQSGKVDESLRIAERMFNLYRSHSRLYKVRTLRKDVLRLQWRLRQLQQQEKRLGTSTNSSSNDNGGALRLEREELEEELKELEQAVEKRAAALPAGALDAQDEGYKAAYFSYINDKANRSTKEGRRLCLEAMEEFPEAAAPWLTMSLLLHTEDPKKNLDDAILAARHAVDLEPTNLEAVLVLANFYKAKGKVALHHLMLDRYRLLCYMVEHNASLEDLRGTTDEILEMEQEVLGELTSQDEALAEHEMRMSQALNYIVPMNYEKREFREQPIKHPSMEPTLQYEQAHEYTTTKSGKLKPHMKNYYNK